MVSHIETIDRPMVGYWAGHVYITHADLEEMPKWRLIMLKRGLRLLRCAVTGVSDEGIGDPANG